MDTCVLQATCYRVVMPATPDTPAPDAPPTDAVARIERSMRAFKRIGDARRVQRRMQELTGVELDGSSFVALVRIAESGPVRLTDLAAQLWLDLSVVSRKVRGLEERGFVERTSDPADARASRASVTAAGRDVVQRVSEGRAAWLRDLFASWDERDTEQLAELIERFVDDIHASYEREAPAT
ncbi:MAG: MarR-family transcriptional regulator [Thermoleophilia bacterium]|nr:MarR-family transcriptional regulator [Thermoleophilia bacterium]